MDYKAKKREEKKAEEVVLNILECRNKDEIFYAIAVTLHRPQQEIENLFYQSNHPKLVDHISKKRKTEEVILNILER